jgi:hypothetical protein
LPRRPTGASKHRQADLPRAFHHPFLPSAGQARIPLTRFIPFVLAPLPFSTAFTFSPTMETTRQSAAPQHSRRNLFASAMDAQEPEDHETGHTLHPPVFQLTAGGADAGGDGAGGRNARSAGGNATGMPDRLKEGLEQLSGMDLSDVRVHYASDKPGTVGALAYAQGADIHIAPGHDHLLAHEAWHVVQQKQGRVSATTQVNGKGVNDDAALEREADIMGAKAMEMKGSFAGMPLRERRLQDGPIQRILVQIIPKVDVPDVEMGDDENNQTTQTTPPQTTPPETTPTTSPQTLKIDTTQVYVFGDEDKQMEYHKHKIESKETVKEERRLKIDHVHIIGRPKKLFTNSMGDHTTAFGIHSAGIKLALKGKTGEEACIYLGNLCEDTCKLPGYTKGKHSDKMEKAETKFRNLLRNSKIQFLHTALDAQAKGIFLLQSCIAAYLEFREEIAFTAINVAAKSPALAGKGKGESKYIANLVNWEMNTTNINPEDLVLTVTKTFDPFAVAMALVESHSKLFTTMVPGMELDTILRAKTELFVQNHLESLKLSFPTVGLQITDLESHLVSHLVKIVISLTLQRVLNELEVAKYLGKKRVEEKNSLINDKRLERLEGNLNSKIEVEPDYDKVIDTHPKFVVQDSGPRKRLKKTTKMITLEQYYTDKLKNVQESLNKQKNIVEEKGKVQTECTAIQNTLLTSQSSSTLEDNRLNESLLTQNEQTTLSLGKSLRKDERKNMDEWERSQSQATHIIYDQSGCIDTIDFAGRPESPFGNTMGAHTTSWVVYQDWIRARLWGKNVQAACAELSERMVKEVDEKAKGILDLLGNHVDDKLMGRMQGAREAFMKYAEEVSNDGLEPLQQIKLQQMINLFLTYINLIPGTTIYKGNTTGHGESHSRKLLQQVPPPVTGTKRKHTDNTPSSRTKGSSNLLDIKDLPDCFSDDAIKLMQNWHDKLIYEAYTVPKVTHSIKKVQPQVQSVPTIKPSTPNVQPEINIPQVLPSYYSMQGMYTPQQDSYNYYDQYYDYGQFHGQSYGQSYNSNQVYPSSTYQYNGQPPVNNQPLPYYNPGYDYSYVNTGQVPTSSNFNYQDLSMQGFTQNLQDAYGNQSLGTNQTLDFDPSAYIYFDELGNMFYYYDPTFTNNQNNRFNQ